MHRLDKRDWFAISLLVFGGINWGLYGIFGLDLIEAFLGSFTVGAKVIYALLGFCAMYVFVNLGIYKRK